MGIDICEMMALETVLPQSYPWEIVIRTSALGSWIPRDMTALSPEPLPPPIAISASMSPPGKLLSYFKTQSRCHCLILILCPSTSISNSIKLISSHSFFHTHSCSSHQVYYLCSKWFICISSLGLVTLWTGHYEILYPSSSTL